MLIWSEKLIPTPIMSLQTGGRLALATKPIINPQDLSIVAFYCEGPNIDFQPAILHANDIREFGELGLIVNDSDDIMPLDDMVRLQEIIDYQFDLIGKKVVDTASHKLGKANNYVVETDSFKVMKFSVKRPLIHSLQQNELIIGRQQIRKVTDHEIVVAAPTAEEETGALAQHQIQNPFRRHTPAERPAEHITQKSNPKSNV